MLRIIFVAFVMVFSAQGAHAAFSEGCRMGQLTKYSEKGWVNKSGEGEMMIGRAGGAYTTPSRGDSPGSVLNPWSFSADVEQSAEIEEFLGRYAVICYEQAQFNTGLSYGTDYRVVSVEDVEREEPDLANCEVVKPDTSWHDGGTRIGRIAKASYKGTFDKTFEIILQQGDSGSNFIEMSISDEHMYDCAMRALRSGMQVRVDYVEYAFSLRRDTNYDIYRISIVDSDI